MMYSVVCHSMVYLTCIACIDVSIVFIYVIFVRVCVFVCARFWGDMPVGRRFC